MKTIRLMSIAALVCGLAVASYASAFFDLGSTVKMNTSRSQLLGVAVDDSTTWVTAVDAGGVTSTDNSGTVRGSGDVTAATRHWCERDRRDHGFVRFRLKYNDDVAGTITPLKFKVLLKDTAGNEEFGVTQGGTLEVTITPDTTTDYLVGGYYYSNVDVESHVVDLVGNDALLIGVTQAFNATSGTISDAVLQVASCRG